VGFEPVSPETTSGRHDEPGQTRSFLSAIGAIAIAAAALRYYDLGEQIPLGDEWHSLSRAAKTSLTDLWTHYFRRATSIPVNVFQRWVLEVWGWNELSIRALSVLSTLATLLLLPLGVYQLLRSRVAAICVSLTFALSPFWIFYGQNSRPYAPFFLLLLLCFYSFRQALASNRPPHWFGFALSGALAVYFHLYALPAVGSLAAVVVVCALGRVRQRPLAAGRLVFGSALAFAAFAVLAAAPYVPALIHGFSKELPAGDELRPFDTAFFHHGAELLTGTSHLGLSLLLVAFSAAGLVWLFRVDRLTFGTLLAASAGCTVFTLLVRPAMYDVAIVFLRYNVALFALYFLGLACFIDGAASLLQRRFAARRVFAQRARVAVPLVLLVAGAGLASSPIPTTQAIQPNNFRQHAAYQEFYSGWDPNRVRGNDFFGPIDTRTAADIHPFYGGLRKSGGSCRIIEFPLALFEYYVPYYFYQYYHRCEVLAGYTDHDQIGGMLNLDDNRDLMRFRQLVDLQRPERVRATKADFLIVHSDLRREIGGRRGRLKRVKSSFIDELTLEFGPPIHRDRTLTVFALGRAAP
jgi:hypothetical protein